METGHNDFNSIKLPFVFTMVVDVSVVVVVDDDIAVEVDWIGFGGIGHFGPQLPQFPLPPTCWPESSIKVEHQAPPDESPSQLQSL